jgi:hypothetical protein
MSRYKNAVNVVNRELYLIMLCHAQKILKRKLEIFTELLIFPMYEVLDIILLFYQFYQLALVVAFIHIYNFSW